MASHHLIDAYLATLARQLPADAVDELADGLAETYQHHRSTGLEPDIAARNSIAEFGTPDLVTEAFVRHAPGRRAALMLLGTGPIIGLCCGCCSARDSPYSGRSSACQHRPGAVRIAAEPVCARGSCISGT